MKELEEKEEKKGYGSIIIHIEWIIVFITLLGGFYSLDARIDAINSRFDQFMIAWHEEAKDFHGKLERHDAEYKAHMMHLHHKE